MNSILSGRRCKAVDLIDTLNDITSRGHNICETVVDEMEPDPKNPKILRVSQYHIIYLIIQHTCGKDVTH